MNTLLNYFLEANLGLIFFMAMYMLFLRNENQFSFKRIYLVVTICLSLTLPLIKINIYSGNSGIIPSFDRVISQNWLHEVIINGQASAQPGLSYSGFLVIGYVAVATFLFIMLCAQLIRIASTFIKSEKYPWNGLQVCESDENKPTFSFFHFIFIGQANKLDDKEKDEILLHESVHVSKFHSFDVVLISLVGIVFWLNPVVRLYKSTLAQLHEFEADEVSIQHNDVDEYCSLLSKVTLQAAGYSAVNHFSHSLTLKRINMMKTIKQKIKVWKIAAVLSAMPIFFITVSCQDQGKNSDTKVGTMTESAKPAEVQEAITKLQEQFPSRTYSYYEGTTEEIVSITKNKFTSIQAMYVWDRDGKKITGVLLSSVPVSNNSSADSKQTGEIFMVVENPPTPKVGMTGLYEYFSNTIRYPESAAKAHISGSVYVSFVVNTDGSLSEVKVLKSLTVDCDAEAVHAVEGSPAWNPGKQNGRVVRTQFTLPISFKLGNETSNHDTHGSIKKAEHMQLRAAHQQKGNLIEWEGTALDDKGVGIPGVNILVKGTPQGTVTDSDGHFRLAVDQQGTLIAYFVGFETVELPFSK